MRFRRSRGRGRSSPPPARAPPGEADGSGVAPALGPHITVTAPSARSVEIERRYDDELLGPPLPRRAPCPFRLKPKPAPSSPAPAMPASTGSPQIACDSPTHPSPSDSPTNSPAELPALPDLAGLAQAQQRTLSPAAPGCLSSVSAASNSNIGAPGGGEPSAPSSPSSSFSETRHHQHAKTQASADDDESWHRTARHRVKENHEVRKWENPRRSRWELLKAYWRDCRDIGAEERTKHREKRELLKNNRRKSSSDIELRSATLGPQ